MKITVFPIKKLSLLKISGLFALVLLFTLSACNKKLPTTEVDPTVFTLAKTHAVIDISNNGNNCSSSSSPPVPIDYYRSLPQTAPLNKFNHGMAGAEVWRNQTCNSFRQDFYRTIVKYDLSSLSNIKGLVTKAVISFQASILPQQTPLCDPSIGGGGAFSSLPIASVLPQSHFETTTQFPRGRLIFNIAGQLVPGVTSSPTGLGGTLWEVDVTTQVTRSLDNGDSSLSFMLEGRDETQLNVGAPPAANSDCRTIYSFKVLTVTHL